MGSEHTVAMGRVVVRSEVVALVVVGLASNVWPSSWEVRFLGYCRRMDLIDSAGLLL